jgi:hypothetical protein
MPDEFEKGIFEQVEDIAFAAGEEVVEADDLVTFIQQAFAQMGSKESRSTGDQNAHAMNAEQKDAAGKTGELQGFSPYHLILLARTGPEMSEILADETIQQTSGIPHQAPTPARGAGSGLGPGGRVV